MNIPPTLFVTGLVCLLSLTPAKAQQNFFDSYYSGDYETVLKQTTTAIESGDTMFNTVYLKALSEVQLGRTENAIQTLEMANTLFPEDLRIKKMLAGQYYNAGAYVEARDHYYSLIQVDSSDIASLHKLAEISSFTQRYKEAIPNLGKILALDSANLNSLIMMGDILSRQNDSSAIAYYERASEIYPDNQKVAYALGNWYIQAKYPDKAVPVCERILQKDSTNIKFNKLLGLAYYKMGDPVPAIKHFQKATVLGDSTAFTLKFLGISHYMTVNFTDAIEALQIAANKDSLDAETHYFLGASLAGTSQKERAMTHLDQSLELMKPDPSVTSRIYSEQGNILRLEMKYEKAYERYNLAWETDTTNLMALFLMASILDNSMHLSEEALVDYQRFIDQVNLLPKTERSNSQIPTIRDIVEDRIIMLKEELFFLDK
jgi:tetratricopeptide (TPR) repeat protein